MCRRLPTAKVRRPLLHPVTAFMSETFRITSRQNTSSESSRLTAPSLTCPSLTALPHTKVSDLSDSAEWKRQRKRWSRPPTRNLLVTTTLFRYVSKSLEKCVLNGAQRRTSQRVQRCPVDLNLRLYLSCPLSVLMDLIPAATESHPLESQLNSRRLTWRTPSLRLRACQSLSQATQSCTLSPVPHPFRLRTLNIHISIFTRTNPFRFFHHSSHTINHSRQESWSEVLGLDSQPQGICL